MGIYPRHEKYPIRNIPVFDENWNIRESQASGLNRHPIFRYPMSFTQFDRSVPCVRDGPAGTSAGGHGAMAGFGPTYKPCLVPTFQLFSTFPVFAKNFWESALWSLAGKKRVFRRCHFPDCRKNAETRRKKLISPAIWKGRKQDRVKWPRGHFT